MSPHEIADCLIVIVSAAVFAVLTQQAGTDQNLHGCILRFPDAKSFPYFTTLFGIEKENSVTESRKVFFRLTCNKFQWLSVQILRHPHRRQH